MTRFPCPDVWALDDSVVHLNHGSFGAVPRRVLDFQLSFRDKVEANPDAFYSRDIVQLLPEARAVAAQFLGADEVAFVANATAGVNAALNAAKLSSDDEVIICNHSYGGIVNAARHACERSGANLVVAHVDLDDVEFNALLDSVTPRTTLAIVDHITSPTAIVAPIDDLVAQLSDRGVRCIVDAAHVPGTLDVDLSNSRACWWTGNFHKWAGAPRGTAVLYASPEVRDHTGPTVTSELGGTNYPSNFDWTGTNDYSAWLSLPIALETLSDLGWHELRSHNDRTVAAGAQIVAEATKTKVRDHGAAPLAMRVIDLPSHVQVSNRQQALALMTRIATEAGCEVAVNTFGGEGKLRVSACGYNSIADFERLAVGLRTLLDS